MNSRPLPLIPSSPLPIAALGLAAAFTVGVAIAVKPALGIGLLVGVIYVPFVLIALPAGLALWIALAFNAHLTIVSIAPTAAALLVLVAWAGSIRDRLAAVRDIVRRHRTMVAAGAGLVIWITLSGLWANDTGKWAIDFWQWWTAGLVFAIVATTLGTRRSIKLFVALFVAGAVVSVVVGLVAGMQSSSSAIDSATHTEGRLQGGGGDPNYLAAGVVAAIVLASGLIPVVRGAVVRWGLSFAIGVLAVGLAATESRGGLLAAAVAVAAAGVIFRRRRAQVLAWLAVAISVGAVWFASSPSAWHRVTTFDSGGNGRTELWHVAWNMFKDHPIVGVGDNNFVVRSAEYVREPGSLSFVDLISERPHVVHNAYLQLLAETGVVGLALFGIVVLGALRAALAAARHFEAAGDSAFASLSRAVAVAIIGALAASAFLSNATDERLWALLALGPALLMLSGRRGGVTAAGAQRPAALVQSPAGAATTGGRATGIP